MSEFYSARRTLFADLGGLAGMGLGAFLAAMTVWKVLATGFRTGEMEKAFAIFLAVVGGAGAVGGALGLAGGRWFARRWEERHRAHRPQLAVEDIPAPAVGFEPFPATLGTLHVRPLSIETQRALALVRPSGAEHGVPWGTWDGPRLVAVAWVRHGAEEAVITSVATDAGYDPARIADLLRTSAAPPLPAVDRQAPSVGPQRAHGTGPRRPARGQVQRDQTQHHEPGGA